MDLCLSGRSHSRRKEHAFCAREAWAIHQSVTIPALRQFPRAPGLSPLHGALRPGKLCSGRDLVMLQHCSGARIAFKAANSRFIEWLRPVAAPFFPEGLPR